MADPIERLRAAPSAEGTWVGGWLALGIALFLLLSGRRPEELSEADPRLLGVLLWVVAGAAFALTRRAAVVVVYAIGVGFLLRAVDFNSVGRSDVLSAVNEWIATLLAGQNPYQHFFTSTSPPGSPVPYPPIQFLVHLPGYLLAGYDGVRWTEVALSLAVVAALAALGHRFGWLLALPAIVLTAMLPDLINLSIDASNDTSSGAVLFGAALVALYAERRGLTPASTRWAGVAAGLALGMKQTAVFVLFAVACWVWRRAGVRGLGNYVFAALAVVLVMALPFLVLDPGSFLSEIVAFGAGFHADLYGWNIWVLLDHAGFVVPSTDTSQLVGLAIIAVAAIPVLLVRYQRLSSALIAGVLLTVATLLAVPWTSYSYFALIAPILVSLPLIMVIERSGEQPLEPEPVVGEALAYGVAQIA